MRKLKFWETIAIGLVAVSLGIILSLQFKVVQNSLLGGLVPSRKSAEIASELVKVREEKDKLLMQLAEVENKLDEIEESSVKDNQFLMNLKNDVKKYKTIGGFTDVTGSGITIKLDNPPEDMTFSSDLNIIDDYTYIIYLVNELKAAGAEAIAVNGQRIIATSEIRQASDAINVNSIPLSAPITIDAIGNPDTLEGALSARFGYVEAIREKNYQIEVKKMSKIDILKYSGVVKFKYAEEVE